MSITHAQVNVHTVLLYCHKHSRDSILVNKAVLANQLTFITMLLEISQKKTFVITAICENSESRSRGFTVSHMNEFTYTEAKFRLRTGRFSKIRNH